MSFKSLAKLSIRNCSQSMQLAPELFGKIKNLDFSYSRWITGHYVSQLAPLAKEIKKFSIIDCINIRENSFIKILVNMKKLKYCKSIISFSRHHTNEIIFSSKHELICLKVGAFDYLLLRDSKESESFFNSRIIYSIL